MPRHLLTGTRRQRRDRPSLPAQLHRYENCVERIFPVSFVDSFGFIFPLLFEGQRQSFASEQDAAIPHRISLAVDETGGDRPAPEEGRNAMKGGWGSTFLPREEWMHSIQGKNVVTGRCGCESEMKRSAVGLRSDLPHRGRRGRAVHGKRRYSVGSKSAWFSSANRALGFG